MSNPYGGEPYRMYLRDEVHRWQTGATRYETARLLNPRQWQELWRRNMAGENFDAMIDDIAANPNREWTYEPD